MAAIVRIILFICFIALGVGMIVFAGVRYHKVGNKYRDIFTYDKNVLIDWYSGPFSEVMQTEVSVAGVATVPTPQQFSVQGDDFAVYPKVATGLVYNATVIIPNNNNIRITNLATGLYQDISVSPTYQPSTYLNCNCDPGSSSTCTCSYTDVSACPVGYRTKYVPTYGTCYLGQYCGQCYGPKIYQYQLCVAMDFDDWSVDDGKTSCNYPFDASTNTYTQDFSTVPHSTINVLVRDSIDPYYSFAVQTSGTGTFGDHRDDLWNVLGVSGLILACTLFALCSCCCGCVCCNCCKRTKRQRDGDDSLLQGARPLTDYGGTAVPVFIMPASPSAAAAMMGQPLMDPTNQINRQTCVVEQ